MSERELRDELVTALVAGHETTASQLAWLFMQLAREPRVVERLTAELDAGVEDAYLTATIHEIQRLRPVLANATPRLTTQAVRIGDWEYPAGIALAGVELAGPPRPATVSAALRVLPGAVPRGAPGTYTWLPFGGGRRRCIGAAFAQQEMKIVVAAVLRRFAIAPDRPEFERTARRSITVQPSRGGIGRAERRDRPRWPSPGTGSGIDTGHGPEGAAQAFDRYQQTHRVPAVAMAVVKKFGDDQAGNLAALVAYYAFFSLFPLLLVFTTILGFVLSGDQSALIRWRTPCSDSSR